MSDFNLFQFYNKTKSMNILLQFKGALSQEILVEIGDVINKEGLFQPLIRNSFSVFVELSQNIMKYSAEKEMINGSMVGVGIILFIEESDCFRILAGNLIKNSDVKIIYEKLDLVNNSSEEELKGIFKHQLKKPLLNPNSSPGLGFIDIARKAGKIRYQIDGVDNAHSFLTLDVKIAKGDG
jgi:hypothetical protein